MNPAISRRLCAIVLSLFLAPLAPKASAQVYLEPPNFSYVDFRLARQWSYVQTDPTTVAPRIGKVLVSAGVGTSSPIQYSLRMEVEGASYPLDRVRITTVATFTTSAEMDRAFPSGAPGRMIAAWSWGQQQWPVVIPPAEPLLTAPVITNFTALQTWSGGSLRIELNLPPLTKLGFTDVSLTPAPRFHLYIYRADSIDFTSNAQLVSVYASPGTSAVLEGIQAAPGETLYGELRGTDSDSIGWIRFPIRRAPAAEIPVISSGPRSQTLLEGGSATLSVQASGSNLAYQWRKDDVPLAGATGATLEIQATASTAGRYAVVVSNANGQTVSESAVITVIVAPRIGAGPASMTVSVGQAVQLSVTGTGTSPLSYQWFYNGTPIPNATSANLSLPDPRVNDRGSYTVSITNPAGAITSSAATVDVLPITRISNFSIRSQVGSGGQLTVGFSIGGPVSQAAKPVLIRAVGPTLAAFGVDSALPDPRLVIRNGQTEIAQNDDWAGGATIQTASTAVGAFGFASPGSRDAALLHSAPSGSYTVQITGGAVAGIALAEVYDTTGSNDFTVATPRFSNVSALTGVGTGSDILIAGFSITGSSPKTVLIRGIGPALTAFGVGEALSDPKLELYQNGVAAAYAVNDNWGSTSNATQVATAATSVAAFALPPDSRDAALLITLPPGSYTAQVGGMDNTSGTALVEIYEIP